MVAAAARFGTGLIDTGYGRDASLLERMHGCGMRDSIVTSLRCRPMTAVASFHVDAGAYVPISARLNIGTCGSSRRLA